MRSSTNGPELVGVEDPAARGGLPFPGELLAGGVELLDLLGYEPHDRVGVGAPLQDLLQPRRDVGLLPAPGLPRLLVEDA